MTKIKMFFLLNIYAKDIKNRFKLSYYFFINLMRKLGILIKFDEIMEVEFKNNIKVCFKPFSAELAPYMDIFIYKVYEIDERFIPAENDIVFDIGANIGLYTIKQSKRVSIGKVYSFEPNPFAYGRLKRNILINKLENVVSNQVAIGKDSGKVRFSFKGTTTTGYISSNGNSFEVERVSLGKFIEKNNISKINIMKIDTEGSELEILKGGEETLKLTEKIVMEYHSEELKNEVIAFLKSNGFKKLLENDKILYFYKI